MAADGQTRRRRWAKRPENANWGEFGEDDQIGRLNLIGPSQVKAAAAEIKEGLSFCLSLPLDYPGKRVLAPYRFPPRLAPTEVPAGAYFNFPFRKEKAFSRDVVCDDYVTLCTQYSTHWDGLAHIGRLFDADDDGEVERVYYNGYRADLDVIEPARRSADRETALGVEHLAEHGVQGRGVLIDMARVASRSSDEDRRFFGYDAMMRLLEEDGVEIERGDILCLHTGFSALLLSMRRAPDLELLQRSCPALDGCDRRLLDWIDESGVAAIAADNFAVEAYPPRDEARDRETYVPLHQRCLFELGLPLGELWRLDALRDWLTAQGRRRFFLTAPPLRLPGATGSPTTPIATV